MKAEKEMVVASEPAANAADAMIWPEPQSEWGRELLALMKAVDASGIPKLSVEEIEAYLERPSGNDYPRACGTQLSSGRHAHDGASRARSMCRGYFYPLREGGISIRA